MLIVRPGTPVDIILRVTSNGVGIAGESPTITIFDLADWSEVVTDASMTDRDGGTYSYNFIVGVDGKHYLAVMKVTGDYAVEQLEQIEVVDYTVGSIVSTNLDYIIERPPFLKEDVPYDPYWVGASTILLDDEATVIIQNIPTTRRATGRYFVNLLGLTGLVSGQKYFVQFQYQPDIDSPVLTTNVGFTYISAPYYESGTCILDLINAGLTRAHRQPVTSLTVGEGKMFLEWFNDLVANVLAAYPEWPFMLKYTTLTTNGGTPLVSKPSDMADGKMLFIIDGSSFLPLTRVTTRSEHRILGYNSATQGTPNTYFETADSIYFDPCPATSKSYICAYFKKWERLGAGATYVPFTLIPSNFFHVLIQGMYVAALRYERQSDEADRASAAFGYSLQSMVDFYDTLPDAVDQLRHMITSRGGLLQLPGNFPRRRIGRG